MPTNDKIKRKKRGTKSGQNPSLVEYKVEYVSSPDDNGCQRIRTVNIV